MRLLSLDPSTTCIGYAVFDGRTLAECGKLTPERRDASPLGRVLSLRRQLLEMLPDVSPDTIIVEAMIEKQFTRQFGRITALPLCGWAMGVTYGTCLGYSASVKDSHPCTVAVVGNQQWVRGKSKDDRICATAVQFPAMYNHSADPGGDIADAIEMGLWWMTAVDRQEKVDRV